MIWINFLHLYQPANAEFQTIKEALDKSYYRLLRLLEENNDVKFAINITACLLIRLEEEGELDFINRLKKLIKQGKVELTGSAAYHPLLPLIPEKEIKWQIKEQERVINKLFGKIKLRGFFLPEMAYSPAVAKIVKKLGYEWIILDEISYQGNTRKKIDINQYYVDKNSGLKVVFRDRKMSHAYVPDSLKEVINQRDYLITATDSELYGLRHEDPSAELEKVVKLDNLKTETISWFIDHVSSEKKKIKLYSSSWETEKKDMKNGVPFRLWLDKNNNVQVYLWKLAKLALQVGEKYKNDKNYYWYRWHLNRGLASCTFWWASAYDFSHVFGPLAWNPDMIEKGTEDLIRSIRSIDNKKSRQDKLKAEKYYSKIKGLIWQKHWQKHW